MKSLFNFQYLFHLLVVLFHNASGNVIINSHLGDLVSQDIQDVATCPVNIWEPCVIRETGTSVVNEDPGKYPSGYTRIYQYQPPQGTCQVRLDFNIFELGEPDIAGNCNADSTIVGGLNLCGNNTGQHIYVEFGYSSTVFMFVRISNPTRIYNITSTYIACNSGNEAPSGCIQFFTAVTDVVKSFNYPTQTNNLEYSVCVRTAYGMGRIRWEECTNAQNGGNNPFFISGPPSGVQIGQSCFFDFVQINGLYRYCGDVFATVITGMRPFELHVRFDQVEGPTAPFPTTSAECVGQTIPDLGLEGTWTCMALGSPPDDVCNCQFESFATNPPNPGAPPIRNPEFDNTGFCLQYTQLP